MYRFIKELSKNIFHTYGNCKRQGTGKQNDGIFKSLADFKQKAVQCIPQRLCAHGNRKAQGNHFSNQILRCFGLDKG